WSGFGKPFEGVSLVATVECACPDSPVEFRLLEFNPGAGVGVWHVDFPIIGALREVGKDGQGDELEIPLLQGLLVHKPLETIVKNEKVNHTSYGTYPGLLTMQCFAYYNKDMAGLYLASHDGLGNRKDFVFDSDNEGNGRFRVRNYPENMGFKGRTYSATYSFAVTAFQGGWAEASQIYRNWATRQAWCRKGKLSQRSDLSNWFRDTSLWIWNRGNSDRISPGPIELKKKSGVNVALDWYWWHHNPYDVFVPEYLPPREGVPTFIKTVDKLHSEGVKTVVYINGRIWDMNSGSWDEQKAYEAAALDENLKPYEEKYNIFMPENVIAPMCPTTQLWRDKISYLVSSLVGDLHLDGVYIDQVAIATAELCHNPEHGHPVGGGHYWVHGYNDLIRTARDRARKANSDACLLSESCIEQFIDCFDGFLTLDASWERTGANLDLSWDKMGLQGQTWEPIPMFNAVYHDYAITFGSYTSMTGVPPYDDLWPESGRPPEFGKFVTYNDKYPDQFAFELARTLSWGIQPMVTNVYPEMLGRKEFDADMEFLTEVARFHSSAREYLTLGKWVKPPEVNCPCVAVKIYVRSIYTAQDRVGETVRNSPAVLSSAWASYDGNVCVVLVNFTRDAVDAEFSIDLNEYGFESDDKITVSDYPNHGNRTRLPSHKLEKSVTLPSRSVVAYEFSAE
ncbi:MAG TPA: DUF6259 domain-containing protein, partial [Thermoproteota archaeon]|nr:DUF6259 domain-containing protein [Thermoproteota archaeon]